MALLLPGARTGTAGLGNKDNGWCRIPLGVFQVVGLQPEALLLEA